MSDFDFKIDTKELDRIAGKLNLNRKQVGKRIAFEIEKEAKQRAPVDTSALKNSIYTVTEDDDGYSSASGAAMGKAWTNGGRISETERHPTPTGNVIANVGPCVEYAEYVEMGTSKMAAQPYLLPAVEAASEKYNSGEAWKELFE